MPNPWKIFATFESPLNWIVILFPTSWVALSDKLSEFLGTFGGSHLGKNRHCFPGLFEGWKWAALSRAENSPDFPGLVGNRVSENDFILVLTFSAMDPTCVHMWKSAVWFLFWNCLKIARNVYVSVQLKCSTSLFGLIMNNENVRSCYL